MNVSSAESEALPTACRHCGTATEGEAYCCQGCEMAAAILSDAGLDAWYERRTDFAPRPSPVRVAWDRVEVVAEADGTCSARLAIDGLRCASCVWVTERLLEQADGVRDAHVSYATGRATLRWDPTVTDLGEVCERVRAVGYQPRPVDAAATPDRDLLTRLGVAAFCTANLMGIVAAVYVGWWQGMDEAWATLFRWVILVLATPVALWSARPFFDGAIRGLSAGILHMDVPVSLAVAILYGHGVVATLQHTDGYLDSLAMLVTLLLVGRVLEARGRRQVQEAVGSLAAQLPAVARRVRDGLLEEVPPHELQRGDQVEVPTGTEVPADGVVVEGRSAVRMSLLTGESEPRAVGPGDEVVAGGIVEGDVPLRIEVTEVGTDTLLGRMAGALERSLDQGERKDRIAPWFTAGTLLAAGGTFAGWTALVGTGPALQHTIAVLVVACPCALALARPLNAAAGLAAAARRGLLLRNSDALFDLAAVRHVALDKTGTLTGGVPEVVDADDQVLRVAAGLERSSAHPIARAILREAIRRGIPLPHSTDLIETTGVGIEGTVDGVRWVVRGGGPGVVAVYGPDGIGHIRLRDVPRLDARATVMRLRELGVGVTILTGDRAEVADLIGASVDAPAVSEVDPLAKAAWLRAQTQPTLFVGDGLNDGPALVEAHVGIAMGSGASASVLAADGVVSDDAIGPILAGLQAARITDGAVRRSLYRSVTYNVVAVAAAMAGLVNPLVAALLMPLSSLLVIWEASRVEARMEAA